jgi:hypothetical protein
MISSPKPILIAKLQENGDGQGLSFWWCKN